MIINADILPLIAAGLINSTFVIPPRYIQHVPMEKIWFIYTIMGLLILPWIYLTPTFSDAIHLYLSLDKSIFMFLLFIGILFGISQVCFSYALRYVGIALSFSVNLGISVVIGSLYVIFYRHLFFTKNGLIATFAVFLIVCGLIMHYFVSKKNQATQSHPADGQIHRIGWLLAISAGIGSGLQNIAFVTTLSYAPTTAQTLSSFWVWPPFLLAAAIPMLTLYWLKGNKFSLRPNMQMSKIILFKNLFLITLMGAFSTGSLSLYSFAINRLSPAEQIIGWPTFMVSIILCSQWWEWFYLDKIEKNKPINPYKIVTISLYICAIIILTTLHIT